MVCSTIHVSFAPEYLTMSHPLSSIKLPQKLARRGKGLGWIKAQSTKSGDIESGWDDSLYAKIILSYHIVSVLIYHISYIAFHHIQDDYPITSNQIHFHWDDSKPIFSVCGIRPRKIIVLVRRFIPARCRKKLRSRSQQEKRPCLPKALCDRSPEDPGLLPKDLSGWSQETLSQPMWSM